MYHCNTRIFTCNILVYCNIFTEYLLGEHLRTFYGESSTKMNRFKRNCRLYRCWYAHCKTEYSLVCFLKIKIIVAYSRIYLYAVTHNPNVMYTIYRDVIFWSINNRDNFRKIFFMFFSSYTVDNISNNMPIDILFYKLHVI